jgi:hypothetical protein
VSRSLPAEFHGAVGLLTERLPRLLAPNLVGVYVYGSALDPSFVPGRSDLDCIVVTETALDEAAFDALGTWLTGAAREDPNFARVQMSLLVRDRVLEDDPAACLYQFGVLTHSGSDGNPIIWLDFYQRGMVLHGPDPRAFVPKITPAVFRQALVREVGYLREEISTRAESESRDRPAYQAYAVLTLCRILYSDATGTVTSKAAAAAWAIAETPGEPDFHDLIRVADDVSNERRTTALPLPLIERFISYVEERVGDPSAGRGAGSRSEHLA